MQTTDIVTDAIGQLNLILWITEPLPGGGSIHPVLHEAGYYVYAIGPVLPLIPELRGRLAENGMPRCRIEPSPDLVLKQQDIQEYLMLECKRSMFGADSSAAEQARGLLLQTGMQFNTAIGLSTQTTALTHLLYIAQHDDCHNPAEGLAAIREGLAHLDFAVAPAGVFCLSASDEGVYLRSNYTPSEMPDRLRQRIDGEVCILDVIEGEEPMPLLIIPWDPNVDVNSPVAVYGKEVLVQRLLGSLVVRFGKAHVGQPLAVEFDELLDEATFNFYRRWCARNGTIASTLRTFVRKLMYDYLKDIPGLTINRLETGAGRSFVLDSSAAREAVIDAITKASRGPTLAMPKPEEVNLTLDNAEW